ncbi:phosphoenolpyruvate--protein phosphotransferase [Shewanella gaetbuli]|uniref:Phosphoenolpyruvate-protein phosphotransferase n=1 Tax=Shewanella gaetbuli TaxID=220752 RepID=A0A9X2CK15_9GAMM|nr:phosphoenolpyruvate--protein phosphotransferase [Shewanella gaetbuli]MCL1142636.1 phosphoenolpyruvate--protein phosphotransferase [Shewanella gaetbuli]
MQVNGIVVSTGIALGKALKLTTQPQNLDLRLLPVSSIESEANHLHQAIQKLITYLTNCQSKVSPDCDNFQLIDADILLLQDDELIDEMLSHIRQYRVTAGVAIDRVFTEQAQALENIDDPYLANRGKDIRVLGKRLITTLQGNSQLDLTQITQDTILLADELTPADFAILPLNYIKGIVLESGGLTSHTAILARSARIPALLNCQWRAKKIKISNGQNLALNSIDGQLITAPTEQQLTQLKQQQSEYLAHLEALQAYKNLPSETLDGHKITLRANVGNLNEISSLMEVGADGIGLFRTEFLLINTDTIPNEEQQYQIYCDALHSLNGQQLTIRTFDIGADKDIPFLNQALEENPALGVRGIRYSLLHPKMFIQQIKAILRAAAHGNIRLMFPMICQLEELNQVFKLIDQAKTQLQQGNIVFGIVEYGIVVETPAAVLNLSSMLAQLDFVSIGSNDLTQYTLAADRTNPQLVSDYPPLSPAVIKLISMTIEQCKLLDVKVCLCGELGGNNKVLPLLVGMGIDELSLNPSNLLAVKARLVKGNYRAFCQHADQIKSLSTIDSIDQAINQF